MDIGLDIANHQKNLMPHLWALTKPRLSLLSVMTVMVGYLIALPQGPGYIFLALLVGSALAAGGCAALNQGYESQADAQMVRTRLRPVPNGSVSPHSALVYGFALCIVGDVILAIGAGANAAFLAILTQISYVYVYTPLKTQTPWNTELGAVSGALPPLIGWSAAQPQQWGLGWILFGILFAWQMPHFMALAQMYRDDYARARFKMLSVTEPSGRAVSRKGLIYTSLLFLLSLLPTVLGYTTVLYAVVVFFLGLFFMFRAIVFVQKPLCRQSARKLFFASIIYLPLLLIVLTVDRCLIR